MKRSTFYRRSMTFYWRSNLAVLLGVICGTATLAGALLVGDSMRGSLRDLAVGRLGPVDEALLADRFFTVDLVERLAESGAGEFEDVYGAPCPLIVMRGSATQAETRATAHRVNIYGVDGRFADMMQGADGSGPLQLGDGAVALNGALSRELGAQVGDDVLLRVGKPSAIPTETLLGRRDQTTKTLRLTVSAIVADADHGDFTLNAQQTQPRNAFVSLASLQRSLDQEGKVNAILVADQDAKALGASSDDLQRRLDDIYELEDLGFYEARDEERRYVSLQSSAFLIEPAVEEAILDSHAANATDTFIPILTYLANSISVKSSSESSIPYSTISALGSLPNKMCRLSLSNGQLVPDIQSGEIYLNEWAAEDLNSKPGDRIEIEYYITDEFGSLRTESADFILMGVVRLDPFAADANFTPEYPGVTDTESLSDWDPPFPVDLNRVREKDEAYWDRYGPAPKAFISLEDGQRLWTSQEARFGRITSIRGRLTENDADSPTQIAEVSLHAEDMGLRFQPVHQEALQAGQGSTDFGMLFIGLSFFVVISAAMLVALLFRLGVDRRTGEVGLLLAVGFSPRHVTRMLLIEGAVIAAIGGAVGLLGAAGYAWLMLAGLRSWWAAAANAPFLTLHVTGASLAIGYTAGLVVAVGSIAWSMRGLARRSPCALLAGAPAESRRGRRCGSGRVAKWVGLGSATAVIFLMVLVPLGWVPATAGFFLGGTLALSAFLAITAWRWRQKPAVAITNKTSWAVGRLGVRNAGRHLTRSLLTMGLVASATFLIGAMEAMRRTADAEVGGRESGTGGFDLLAESAMPLHYDLNTPEGRESINAGGLDPFLEGGDVVPFRLRPGDATGCLNLYRPTEPRIIGATKAMIERGGFRFGPTMGLDGEAANSPWSLLHHEFADGALAAIGDENAVMWQLKSGLGKDIVVTDDVGNPRRLRFVALLRGSVLQDEVIVSESNFTSLFPSTSGYAFFLIDSGDGPTKELEQALERELTDYGFDADSTVQRLNEFLAVENTYLSTFQNLGGLGLALGTFGLGAVLLRNVWERRGELALLRALGFSNRSLATLVLAENLALVVGGLVAGAVSAGMAVAPAALERPGDIGWLSLLLTLLVVLACGVASSGLAVRNSLKVPLIPALRRE